MVIASKGHFLMQIPQPMQSSSEMKASFELGVTSIQSFPRRTTGQDRLHSCRHFFGLHLSSLMIATRVNFSDITAAFQLDQNTIRNNDYFGELKRIDLPAALKAVMYKKYTLFLCGDFGAVLKSDKIQTINKTIAIHFTSQTIHQRNGERITI